MKKKRTGTGKGIFRLRRVFVVFLCMSILFTTQPEIWNGFSVFAAGESDTRLILFFAELSEGVRAQTVSVGTGREELKLPEELTVFSEQEENSSVSDSDAEPEADIVDTLENPERETRQIQETVAGITWQSDPAYDENAEGTYIFTAVLPDGYVLAEGVSLPQITVAVQADGAGSVEVADGIGAAVQALLARIDVLPDLVTMLEDAPGEGEEGYEAWEARFLEAVLEAQDLKKAYDAFTEAERAQIPEEIYAKLIVWWEYARMMGETDLYANPPAWGGSGYAPVRGWGNDLHNKNAVYALGNNLTLKAGESNKTKVYYTGSDTPIDLANLGEISSNASNINYSFQGGGDAASGFDLTNSGVVATWVGDYYGYRDEETGTGAGGRLEYVFNSMNVEIRIEGGTLLGLSNISPNINYSGSATLYMTGGTWLGGDGVDNAIRANEAYVSGGCMKGSIKEWFGLHLSGSPVIGEESGGLWMKNGKKFYLDGALSSGAEIYINPQADFADDSVVAEGSGYTIQESDLTHLHLTGDHIENRELKLVNNQILLVTPTVPPHVHDGGITFDKELPATGGELAGGNYYLTGDVSLIDSIKIQSGVEVNLCLNGHTLYGTGSNYTVQLYGGTLNVYDCDGGGVLSGDNGSGRLYTAVGGYQSQPGIFNLYGGKVTSSGSRVISGSTSTFNLFGGVVEGGTTYVIESVGNVTISGNTVVSGGNSSCAVFINSSAAVLTVKDNASVSSVGDGVKNYGQVNIEGGTITSTKTNGYGICNRGSSAAVNITSGTVTGDKYGVYMESNTATLSLSGSPTVSGKTADLYLQTGTNVTLDNAKVDATGYTGGTLTVTEDSPSGKAGSYAIKVSEGNKDKFTLTNSGWHYSYKDGGLYLDNHTHRYTYAANGAVITESCSCGHKETATLSLQSGVNLTYTGSAIKPVIVTYSGGWVGTGTNKPDNSKITYINNTNAGTATARLTISGKTASLNFTISARSIGGATVTLDSGDLTYNGQEQTKGVSSVEVNGRTLTAGTDYNISNNTGTNAGEYTITITGKGNYSGTKEVTFSISPKTLTADMVTITSGPHYYTGNVIQPAVTVQLSGVTLPETDYMVSYENNVEPGNATVTVTGKV